MKPTRVALQLFFGTASLPPFEQSPFVRWLEPVLKPLVFRIIHQPFLQAWGLLLVIWAMLMGSLPGLYMLTEALLNLLALFVPAAAHQFFSWMLNLVLLGIGIWGMYYVTRLNLTKLYYWEAEKYPPWPSPNQTWWFSLWHEIERYIFRPEFISLAIVTFIWLQLTHLLAEQGLRAGVALDYQVYISLWVPWLVGAVWPAVSVFAHRRYLEI